MAKAWRITYIIATATGVQKKYVMFVDGSRLQKTLDKIRKIDSVIRIEVNSI